MTITWLRNERTRKRCVCGNSFPVHATSLLCCAEVLAIPNYDKSQVSTKVRGDRRMEVEEKTSSVDKSLSGVENL